MYRGKIEKERGQREVEGKRGMTRERRERCSGRERAETQFPVRGSIKLIPTLKIDLRDCNQVLTCTSVRLRVCVQDLRAFCIDD